MKEEQKKDNEKKEQECEVDEKTGGCSVSLEKKIDYKGYIKRCLNNNIKLKFDFLVISHFFGRWIPFAIAVGFITGSIAALMDVLIVNINKFLTTNVIIVLIYPLLVSIMVGFLTSKDSSVAGAGIGYSVLHLKSKTYLKLKSLVYKFILSVFVLSGGFIAGREGPSFFLGVGIGEWVGKSYGLGKGYKNILGLIGGGAFTGALLKAPLGSSIFAMELENMYDFDYRPFTPMIIASIISYLTFSFFRGTHPFILLTDKPEWTLTSIPYIIIMGLVISLITYIYTFLFHFSIDISKIISTIKRPILGTLVAIPFLVGLYMVTQDIDMLSAPAHMSIVSKLAQIPFPMYVDVAIIVFTLMITSLTIGFGIPGGLVLPNLIIGAATGNIFGHMFPNEMVMFTLAGMGSALSAAAKTPLAAIVMITEMSHADVVIPMTSAVITSYITSFGFSLYLGQENALRPLLKRGGLKMDNSREKNKS